MEERKKNELSKKGRMKKVGKERKICSKNKERKTMKVKWVKEEILFKSRYF